MTTEEINEIMEKEGDEKIFYYKSLRCTISRVYSLGHLCGYIDLIKEIPEYGKDYDSISIQCHGGLTYAEKINEFWRIGFDCAHLGDLSPYMLLHNEGIHFGVGNEVYRDMEYVKSEIIDVIEQLDIINDGLISKLNTKRIREDKLKGLLNE